LGVSNCFKDSTGKHKKNVIEGCNEDKNLDSGDDISVCMSELMATGGLSVLSSHPLTLKYQKIYH
jgi:hypothetical protein